MADASQLPRDWETALGASLSAAELPTLLARVEAERRSGVVYPAASDVFAAFHLTPFERVRVVILGQDPYHGEGQAHGLAFSVKPGVKLPPSLNNIYKELAADVGCAAPRDGCLVSWAEQGVLLLNAVLTVRAGEANAHQGYGWEKLTDAVIAALNAKREHVVFVLWGNAARKKAKLVDQSRHTLVEGAHPSPLSARLWFGSRPFSKINAALQAHGQPAIGWS